MADNLKGKKERATGQAAEQIDRGEHSRRVIEFLIRVESISRSLKGRKHSDSAKLLAEDRAR